MVTDTHTGPAGCSSLLYRYRRGRRHAGPPSVLEDGTTPGAVTFYTDWQLTYRLT